jgi:hypothetical protein
MNTAIRVLTAALFSCSTLCIAQPDDRPIEQSGEKEPAAVLELGGAGSWTVPDGASSFGPTVAVEVTPIENWLELEAGATALFRTHSTEFDIDLLFKKPWTLSRKAELMAGIGPEWMHTHETGVTANAIAAEAVLDFMYWPSKRRRFGWYLEPSFDYSFASGHEKSIAVNGGLLIAVP